ncbi:copper oxidase, partial [Pseudomonas sp. FW215-T2]
MKVIASPFNSFRFLRVSGAGSVLLITFSLSPVSAAPLDDVSPPPPTDPSAYTNPPTDFKAALDALKTMPPANQGSIALPNGVYGTRTTPTTDNVLPPALQTSFKIPT